jgi:hypothetical protein
MLYLSIKKGRLMVYCKQLLIAFFVLTTLSACSLFSSPKPRCVFPDDQTADAPLWLCSEEFVEEYALKILLNTERLPEKFILQKNELLQHAGPLLQTKLQHLFIDSLNQSAVFLELDTPQQALFENSIKLDQRLELEIRLVRNRTSPNGILYGVVGLSDASIEFIVNHNIARLKHAHPILWQDIALGNKKIIHYIQQTIQQTAVKALRQQRKAITR